jgi:glycosyltransferase involved in cell wall biosynthesis
VLRADSAHVPCAGSESGRAMTAPTVTPFFTVFTPTYNRAHTLHRVFRSLSAQTFRNFEWLVVDDGSTDQTPELIKEWARASDFPIRYLRQPHSGRHVAHNRAIREARGEMWTSIDSDDALVPHALQRIRDLWLEIPDSERANFFSVSGLCQDQQGNPISQPFPTSPFDVDVREYMFVHRRFAGEKWGASRMDAVRRFPFPEMAGTNFIPEGVHGLQMARACRVIRFVNEVFRIYYVDDIETGATLSSRRNIAQGAPGRLYYYLWLLNHELDYLLRAPWPFIKAAAMLPVVTRYSGRPLRDIWRGLKNWPAKLLVIAAMPLSLLLSIFFRLIGQRK